MSAIQVEFLKTYVAPRGQGIAGAKGDIREYEQSEQLAALLEDGTLKAVKTKGGGKRETATEKPEAS